MKKGQIFNHILSLTISGILFSSCASTKSIAQEPAPIAFPGAEGFGKFTTGGRGGKVVKVTNLNDDGEGSLRDAIQKKYPRIIVFDVSGTIELERPLDINHGNVTIAGQSAPGDGITIKNHPTNIKADNVIVRYMRFRMGDEKKIEGDALGANQHSKNIIIDHCSISWATDECASFYRNSDFTLQWCIISESLNASVHQKGEHGYGGIWGGENASFHHNLIASHHSRNPRFSGSSTTLNSPAELVDFRNNVIYNWEMNSVYGGEKGRYNMVANYYKPGPATIASKRSRIVEVWKPYGRFYIAENYIEGNEKISRNNWDGGVQGNNPDSAYVEKPFPAAPISFQTAKEAYKAVLANSGASYKRDAVDLRLIEEVKKGSSMSGKNKNGIIDSQADVGGWPMLQSLPAPGDTDNDGIPDEWEKKHGLNPADSSDSSVNSLHKHYTNIEVYLNSIVSK